MSARTTFAIPHESLPQKLDFALQQIQSSVFLDTAFTAEQLQRWLLGLTMKGSAHRKLAKKREQKGSSASHVKLRLKGPLGAPPFRSVFYVITIAMQNDNKNIEALIRLLYSYYGHLYCSSSFFMASLHALAMQAYSWSAELQSNEEKDYSRWLLRASRSHG